MKTKVSYGIALCRYNIKKNNAIETLMIRKKNSYYFVLFVYGKYNIKDKFYIKYMFKNMTFEEKISIMKLNFIELWNKIHVKQTYNTRDYNKYKKIFDDNFLNNKPFLLSLINKTESSDTLWDIPKGRIEKEETELDCAIREFKEETNIDIKDYKIYANSKPVKEVYIDNNVKYVHYYFIAKLKNNKADSYIDYFNINQLKEVSKIKWISYNEIEFLNLSNNNKKNLLNTFKGVIHSFKIANKNII